MRCDCAAILLNIGQRYLLIASAVLLFVSNQLNFALPVLLTVLLNAINSCCGMQLTISIYRLSSNMLSACKSVSVEKLSIRILTFVDYNIEPVAITNAKCLPNTNLQTIYKYFKFVCNLLNKKCLSCVCSQYGAPLAAQCHAIVGHIRHAALECAQKRRTANSILQGAVSHARRQFEESTARELADDQR